MGGVLKVFNIILGVLAAIAAIATIGIIIYSIYGGNIKIPVAEKEKSAEELQNEEDKSVSDNMPKPSSEEAAAKKHEHNYEESIELQATCLSAGQNRFECECGDYYLVDIHATGHKAGDWTVIREATETAKGTRLKKCIYCDEIIVSEQTEWREDEEDENKEDNHTHKYTAAVESEATCTVAGIRKHTCDCGSYYKEYIPAIGHLANEWEIIKPATTTSTGIRQRVCNVCQTLIDSSSIPKIDPSTLPSVSPSPSKTPTPTPSSSATPTPHSHTYQEHVYQPATCTESGVKTYSCSCGSEYYEAIDRDPNNHSYVVTETSAGKSQYVCKRCNHSYID